MNLKFSPQCMVFIIVYIVTENVSLQEQISTLAITKLWN